MTQDHEFARSKTIVVSVHFSDPLLRAGITAALNTRQNFEARTGESCSFVEPESRLLETLRDVDVVIADYESAMGLSSLMEAQKLVNPDLTTKIMILSPQYGELQVRLALERGIQGYLLLGCQIDELTEGAMALCCGRRHVGQSVALRLAESLGHDRLTHREIAVLHLVAAGCANKVVAQRLDIAIGTVKAHVKSILEKLGARTRTEAAALARRRGLIEEEPGSTSDSGDIWHLPKVPTDTVTCAR